MEAYSGIFCSSTELENHPKEIMTRKNLFLGKMTNDAYSNGQDILEFIRRINKWAPYHDSTLFSLILPSHRRHIIWVYSRE